MEATSVRPPEQDARGTELALELDACAEMLTATRHGPLSTGYWSQHGSLPGSLDAAARLRTALGALRAAPADVPPGSVPDVLDSADPSGNTTPPGTDRTGDESPAPPFTPDAASRMAAGTMRAAAGRDDPAQTALAALHAALARAGRALPVVLAAQTRMPAWAAAARAAGMDGAEESDRIVADLTRDLLEDAVWISARCRRAADAAERSAAAAGAEGATAEAVSRAVFVRPADVGGAAPALHAAGVLRRVDGDGPSPILENARLADVARAAARARVTRPVRMDDAMRSVVDAA